MCIDVYRNFEGERGTAMTRDICRHKWEKTKLFLYGHTHKGHYAEFPVEICRECHILRISPEVIHDAL